MSHPYLYDDTNRQSLVFTMTVTDDYKTYHDVLMGIMHAQEEKDPMKQIQEGMESSTPEDQYTVGPDGELIKKDEVEKDPHSAALHALSDPDSLPYEYTKYTCYDTSVGGNEAVNPLWQFNRDDDIIHPLTSIGPLDEETGEAPGGMGRVYSENIDAAQRLLWISLGVTKYKSLASYYANAFDEKLSSAAIKGSIASFGRMFGEVIGFIVSFPFLPIKAFNALYDLALNTTVNKYCEFKPAMFQYFKTVNAIIGYLLTAMHILPQDMEAAQLQSDDIPEVIKNNADIFWILNRAHRRLNREDDQNITLEKAIDRVHGQDVNMTDDDDEWGYWDNFASSFKASMRGCMEFVGFRIEKTTNSSESVSTTVGESSVASTLNAKAKAATDARFAVSGGTGIGVIDTPLGIVKDIVNGAIGSMNLDGLSAAIRGTGYFDIPERWMDSKFTKNYTFTFKLRTPSGNRIDIFQSVYFPFALILGIVMPRATGANSYTSPFNVKAYCKGMFGIPYGIVTNATITRGRSEHGWTTDELPVALDVTMTIKDLSACMYISATGDAIQSLMGSNTNMLEYLNTLAGMGLRERYYFGEKLKTRMKYIVQLSQTRVFSPHYLGAMLGNLRPMRFVGCVWPGKPIGNN